ncbi:MAG: serine/threonine-protein kinase [Rikenellaceae bacterium]
MSSSEFFATPTASNGYSRFELLRESGFNVLYSAERENKRFVVKALSESCRGDLLYESILRKEFEIGYSLDHPNICRTVSFERFEEVGNAIVMEWVDGRTLDRYIAEKQHTTQQLQRIIEQLCDALAYAHKRQTIHRDLKPQNIIITHNGDNVKLLDFGLSDTDSHTVLKEPAGSRKYASPELLRGDKIDSRSDIYSLGVIINELFEGQRTAKISKIVTRATAYYPNSRYSDSQAVASALREGKIKFVYPLLALILVAIGYLFYTMNRATESLIPSAETDGVTIEEFERRQALASDFYREINSSYLSLMNDSIYKMNCATPEMPDFKELSNRQLARYEIVLDSMLGEIKVSSLYLNARRGINSHNSELFTIMRNSFPAMFWINTENLYRAATDPLADSLHRLPAPMLASNYSELSFAEQQAEDERYQKAVQEHKKSTIKVWAEAYRVRHNLAPLPAELLEYYDSGE